MKEKIRQFMIGRYGTDGLNQFLSIASLVLILVYILTRLPLLLYVGVVLLGFCYYRMFSRNISKRTEENYKYYAVKDRIRNKFSGLKDQWDNRRLYHYYRCPQCRQKLRVPRGRGRIQISCPRCSIIRAHQRSIRGVNAPLHQFSPLPLPDKGALSRQHSRLSTNARQSAKAVR